MSGIFVELRKNRRTGQEETQDQLLRRFIKKCKSENILKEYRKNEYFVKPGDKKRIKRQNNRKRIAKEKRLQKKMNSKRW